MVMRCGMRVVALRLKSGVRRLLIIGCGDVALRMLPLVRGRCVLYVSARDRNRFPELRALGLKPVWGDLDRPDTLAMRVWRKTSCISRRRRATVCMTLALRIRSRHSRGRKVYHSTSSISARAECMATALANWCETRPLRPQTERAQRRADAEDRLRAWGARSGVRVTLVRVPGIYAADRLPLERLRRGTPALAAQEDAFVNHEHADDLARTACFAALRHGQPNRSYNAVDDVPQRMGEYFDVVADSFDLAAAPHRARRGRTHAAAGAVFVHERVPAPRQRADEARAAREAALSLVHDGLAAARAER